MKKIILDILGIVSWFWRLLPNNFRLNLITAFMIIDSRGTPSSGLKQLLRQRDRLDLVINERAMAYGKGEHPKHYLINYHQFFIDQIKNGDHVIDVGCGYGAVARSIASAHPSCKVTGVDLDEQRLDQAKKSNNPTNLQFIQGDATSNLPKGNWDVVVLSNVLEHIVHRAEFLQMLRKSTSAKRFLIRVPLFERDWQMALRKELNVDFRSDPDHKIEHRVQDFLNEVGEAGFSIFQIKTLWGEISAECHFCGNK